MIGKFSYKNAIKFTFGMFWCWKYYWSEIWNFLSIELPWSPRVAALEQPRSTEDHRWRLLYRICLVFSSLHSWCSIFYSIINSSYPFIHSILYSSFWWQTSLQSKLPGSLANKSEHLTAVGKIRDDIKYPLTFIWLE